MVGTGPGGDGGKCVGMRCELRVCARIGGSRVLRFRRISAEVNDLVRDGAEITNTPPLIQMNLKAVHSPFNLCMRLHNVRGFIVK